MVYLTRVEHFNAAHKLYNPAWTPEKNEAVFGKCANENWHGHNYEIDVTVDDPKAYTKPFTVRVSVSSICHSLPWASTSSLTHRTRTGRPCLASIVSDGAWWSSRPRLRLAEKRGVEEVDRLNFEDATAITPQAWDAATGQYVRSQDGQLHLADSGAPLLLPRLVPPLEPVRGDRLAAGDVFAQVGDGHRVRRASRCVALRDLIVTDVDRRAIPLTIGDTPPPAT